MWSACCGTRWPCLFSRWRAAGQRKCRPGLIGGVLAIGAGLRVGRGWLRAFFPCDGRAVRGAVDGFAAPVSWTVTLGIRGWVVDVAGHLGLKGAVLKAVRCRVPRRPGLNSVR